MVVLGRLLDLEGDLDKRVEREDAALLIDCARQRSVRVQSRLWTRRSRRGSRTYNRC